MEVKGTVVKIYPKETIKDFEKQGLVVKTNGEYPQEIMFEFIKGNIAQLEGLKEGQEVTVTFDIRGREYNGKHYVNLSGYRVTRYESVAPMLPPLPEIEPAVTLDDDQSLPF